MRQVASKIIQDYPEISFIKDEKFMWSPDTQTVSYVESTLSTSSGVYSLLHEISHAICAHQTYQLDIQLIKLEREAWTKAQDLGKKYGVKIDIDHIEDCIDTYRDWLLSRARCPDCRLAGIQSTKDLTYTCINCEQVWSVPRSQACIVKRTRVTN